MSREAARTTTKSKMSLNLLHRKSLPRLHGNPRYPQVFLKNMLKLLSKLNKIIKLYKMKYEITYIQRNQAASFYQQNATRNTPERATKNFVQCFF